MQFIPHHFSDQNDKRIDLGDLVNVTKGPHKGNVFIFVFCIPQHRYGFMYLKYYNNLVQNNKKGLYNFNMFPEEFVTMDSNLQFYYTPKNKQTITIDE